MKWSKIWDSQIGPKIVNFPKVEHRILYTVYFIGILKNGPKNVFHFGVMHCNNGIKRPKPRKVEAEGVELQKGSKVLFHSQLVGI